MQIKHTGTKTALLVALVSFMMTLEAVAQASDDITNAQTNFNFIANVLQSFQRTGRLSDEIGLDGSEYQDFIRLLENSYQQFTRDFSPDSNFCKFYNDPENAIMEFEERAVLGFQYLPGLRGRQELYLKVSREFEQDILNSFGGIVLDRIRRLRLSSASFEYLPTRDLDAAETVNFADNACR